MDCAHQRHVGHNIIHNCLDHMDDNLWIPQKLQKIISNSNQQNFMKTFKLILGIVVAIIAIASFSSCSSSNRDIVVFQTEEGFIHSSQYHYHSFLNVGDTLLVKDVSGHGKYIAGRYTGSIPDPEIITIGKDSNSVWYTTAIVLQSGRE